MAIRVLIVDDSSFMCKSLKRILEVEEDFQVVGFAHNGLEAISKAAELKPDVITMDVEMPVLDGIQATKRIMAETPTPILMFSALTQLGAKSTLDALSAGAIDFCPKQMDDIDPDPVQARIILRQRLKVVAAVKFAPSPRHRSPIQPVTHNTESLRPQRIRLIVIVASTGGPVAIQKLLRVLPASCPVPILIIQHMPAGFTQSFAERLNSLAQIQVKEAQNGDTLKPGLALVGPGAQQMEVGLVGSELRIKLRAKEMGEIYSPCADLTLTSLAEHSARSTLALILTGMGADGRNGAKKLKQFGGAVWAQDQASCTIYGMPKAVVDAQLADKVYSLDEMAHVFSKIG